MYVTAIVAHATFGVLALGAAVLAFERPPRALTTCVIALVLMLVSLGAAVALEWSTLDTTPRVLFLALTALGVVVVARGVQARGRRPDPGQDASRAYRRALAFTIIALTDAFVIITVLDLGTPVWAVVLTGLVVVAGGHVAVRRRIEVLDARPATPTTVDVDAGQRGAYMITATPATHTRAPRTSNRSGR